MRVTFSWITYALFSSDSSVKAQRGQNDVTDSTLKSLNLIKAPSFRGANSATICQPNVPLLNGISLPTTPPPTLAATSCSYTAWARKASVEARPLAPAQPPSLRARRREETGTREGSACQRLAERRRRRRWQTWRTAGLFLLLQSRYVNTRRGRVANTDNVAISEHFI